jgi:tetratricopeptide (TPR) repeat protein
MNGSHLGIDDLLALGKGGNASPEAKEHLAECWHCRQEARELRGLEADLACGETWDASLSLPEPDPEGSARIRDFARAVEAEDAAARAWMARLPKRAPAEAARSSIRSEPEVVTGGLVRELLARAEDFEQVAPTETLGLARLARELASTLSPGKYPESAIRVLEGLAEKEVGTALRFLGRYPEALAAFDRAETILSPLVASHYDLACLKYSRATVYAATDRNEEALRLTRAAGEVLAEYGDLRRVANARFLEAMVMARRGEHEEAQDVLESLLDPLQNSDEQETLANLFVNLGVLALERGKVEAADRHLRRGLSILSELGRSVPVAKIGWQIGTLLAHSGSIEDGIAEILRSRDALLALELPGHVATLTVELIELLLQAGDFDRARKLCQGLPEECARLGMTLNGVQALAYLRDLSERGSLTPEAAFRVRGFIAGLTRNPDDALLPAS